MDVASPLVVPLQDLSFSGYVKWWAISASPSPFSQVRQGMHSKVSCLKPGGTTTVHWVDQDPNFRGQGRYVCGVQGLEIHRQRAPPSKVKIPSCHCSWTDTYIHIHGPRFLDEVVWPVWPTSRVLRSGSTSKQWNISSFDGTSTTTLNKFAKRVWVPKLSWTSLISPEKSTQPDNNL